MSSMDKPDFHVCHIFVQENNRLVCAKCGKLGKIILTWSDMYFPPINLWNVPKLY